MNNPSVVKLLGDFHIHIIPFLNTEGFKLNADSDCETDVIATPSKQLDPKVTDRKKYHILIQMQCFITCNIT